MFLKITGPRNRERCNGTSTSSTISTAYIEGVIENLKNKQVRNTTSKNYLGIWRHFNKFIIRLDHKPKSWEEKTSLFCGYLIDIGNKSTTVKSYVSAIKAVLRSDGYVWNDQKVLLGSLIQACRKHNDELICRLPIQRNLLEVILFELQRVFNNQIYLQVLYQAIFSMAYYGMMRIGELVHGPHTAKATNVHIGKNKNKILIVLYTSKTHGKESLPQKIKISETGSQSNNCFCPFRIVRQYAALRGDYEDPDEEFFVYKNSIQIPPDSVRKTLRDCLEVLNLNPKLYNTHSFRAGRSVDMQISGKSVDEIRSAGRWRSNAVYRYLKQ